MIVDSGNRREFDTGAVRDIQEGKGRCDLLPLDAISNLFNMQRAGVFERISKFIEDGDITNLTIALLCFGQLKNIDTETMLLEVSIHFEEGAKKYGENNWQKGIPTHCYIDSAVRHYLKWLRGDDDERHDRAFCWNIICCIWTCIHYPELNDYGKGDGNGNN